MSAHCCEHESPKPSQIANLGRYRRILWVALVVNAAMFAIEIVAGIQAGSLALLADAIDFAGDALNYGVSLAVLASALAWRARAALLKAVSMMGFGLFILAQAVWSLWQGEVPAALTMGAVALLALAANVGVAWMLYAFREGDANMRSVWLCSRNDAIGNAAVMLAALGVFGTGSAWPDLLVAALMASLALHGGWSVWQQAHRELNGEASHARPLERQQDDHHQMALHQTLIRQAKLARSVNTKWQLLEAAHVAGQTQLKPHLQTHAMMMKLAWQTRDLKELVGQLFRLVLVPIGHVLGRLPLGNPGRSNVNAFRSMAVRPDLLAVMQSARDGSAQAHTITAPAPPGNR
jgi:cation diffusion facilitator family transporter